MRSLVSWALQRMSDIGIVSFIPTCPPSKGKFGSQRAGVFKRMFKACFNAVIIQGTQSRELDSLTLVWTLLNE